MTAITNIQNIEDPIAILESLVSILNEKEKNVISRRFGLNQTKKETLASIGEDFSVTRERIRQVQSYSIKKLQRNANKTKLVELQEWAQILLKEHGDIITEKMFENQLRIKYPEHKEKLSELKLAAVLFEDITLESNKINFVPHLRKSSIKMKTIQNINKTAIKILGGKKTPLSQNQLVSLVQDKLKGEGSNLRKKLILSATKLDRRIKVKSDSISLTKWRHINPKTLFDKILFVLRKASKPLHFTEITNQIIKQDFDQKSVSQQAVHNELINKLEFVLVGRGVYALKEWGYKKGTVTDVIKEILVSKGPQPYENLIESVLERRKVKQITVQININNKNLFNRDSNNVVSLKPNS